MTRQLTKPEVETLFKECDKINKKAYSRFKTATTTGIVIFACTVVLGVSTMAKNLYDELTKPKIQFKEPVVVQKEDTITEYASNGVLVGAYACLGSFFYGMHSLSPRRIQKKRQKALQNIIQEA